MIPANHVIIILPCFNEGKALRENVSTILGYTDTIQGLKTRLLLVNDGSTDNTIDTLRELHAAMPEKLDYISFTRNFGKEAALSAGLRYSTSADAVIVMDADLEHPPGLIREFLQFWRQGFLVVEATRDRVGANHGLRGWLTRRFYRLFGWLIRMDLGKDTDFKLLDRAVVRDYLALPERRRFFKALIKWGGYRSRSVTFQPGREKKSGGSHWNLASLLAYAFNSITSFTTFPLQLVVYVAAAVFITSTIFGTITLIRWILGDSVEGFTTVIMLLALFSSAIMFSVGLLGFYVGKIYDEVKGRPQFVLDRRNSSLDDQQ